MSLLGQTIFVLPNAPKKREGEVGPLQVKQGAGIAVGDRVRVRQGVDPEYGMVTSYVTQSAVGRDAWSAFDRLFVVAGICARLAHR